VPFRLQMLPEVKPSLRYLSAGSSIPNDASDLLQSHFDVTHARLSDIGPQSSMREEMLVFDLGNVGPDILQKIQGWRLQPSSLRHIMVFLTTDEGRRDLLQRGLLAGANCVRRPLSQENFQALLVNLSNFRAHEFQRKAIEYQHMVSIKFPDQAAALAVAENILDDLIGPGAFNKKLKLPEIAEKSSAIVASVLDSNLERWVQSVRTHHSATYQHSMLVTGTLVAIGGYLGVRSTDLTRLAVGGMMHDIGKADVPLEILDKPSALEMKEMELIRLHPMMGVERAQLSEGISSDIIELIGNHHEYLDGTGYPNRLSGADLGDSVRLLTIADVFAALIEKRSYKQAMTAAEAVGILQRMDGKIDMDFLRAVEPVLLKAA
jgi:HD-GYP domain-containing protein (c-di-GMP phosphodiesterase class II)